MRVMKTRTRPQYLRTINRLKADWTIAQRTQGKAARVATLHRRIVRLTKLYLKASEE